MKLYDVKNAFNWIHNNRNLFRKEVIGPIACEVSPKSNNAASYLEQHVPNTTLKSFVVQDKADYDLLYQKVRVENGVRINIIQVDRITEKEARMYSEEKMAILKHDHGIVGYLDESFDGPAVVMEALKSSARIEKVLVGNDKTQDSYDNRGLAELLSKPEKQGSDLQGYCLFTSKNQKSFKYTSSISKYSGQPSIRYVIIIYCVVLPLFHSEGNVFQLSSSIIVAAAQLEKFVKLNTHAVYTFFSVPLSCNVVWMTFDLRDY